MRTEVVLKAHGLPLKVLQSNCGLSTAPSSMSTVHNPRPLNSLTWMAKGAAPICSYNPKTAVWEYLRRLKEEGRKATDGAPLNFEIDKSIENKLLITVAPDGYLKRVN